MTQVLVTESYLEDIADAIREKSGSESTYTPAQMAGAISALPEPTEPDLVTKAIVANGTYAAEDEGHDGYSQVAVQVPNSYAASDEGKVVSGGALVGQTGMSVSANGTYDTTLNNEVVVDVQGGGSATLVSKTITQNGTYDPTDDNADGYSEVTVNVEGGGDFDYGYSYILTGNLSVISLGAYSWASMAYFPKCELIGTSAFAQAPYTIVSFPMCLSISSYAFNRCLKLTDAIFDKCEVIENQAFVSCSSLASISFPKCKTIGSFAFNNCSTLSSVNFPMCEYVGSSGFLNCTGLTTASFPMCSTVGNNAFSNCVSLANVNLDACISIGDNAFAHCGIIEASFSMVTSIANSVFISCTSLVSVSLPNCEYIGLSGFRECTALQDVYLPKLSALPEYIFGSCGFSEISLWCNTVSRRAFDSCASLNKVTFYNYVVLYSTAFMNCSALEQVYLLASSVCSLNAIFSSVFSATPLVESSYLGHFGSIFVPSNLYSLYISAVRWSNYSSRITSIVED